MGTALRQLNSNDATHSLRSVQQMLKLTRREVAGLVDAGFVTPSFGRRNEWRFTFQDVVLLRTAWGLLRARIPLRKVVASLRRLRATLPESLPLSGLRIAAVGNDVAVIEGRSRWAADSGQLLMAFDVAPERGEVAFIDAAKSIEARALGARGSSPPAPKSRGAAPQAETKPAPGAATAAGATDVPPPRLRGEAVADALFERGEVAEASDAGAAESAYRAALAADPSHVRAFLNLGALLCEAARYSEAVRLYDRAVARRPDEPLLHFNRAIALEDVGRAADALLSYERCLALMPEMADAHFNAARLYQIAGDKQKALRHFSSYRRLERR